MMRRSRGRRTAVGTALLVAATLAGPGGTPVQATPHPADTVQVTVDQNAAGGHVDQRTRGLSLDVRKLATPGLFASPTFARYLRTMSPGAVLRMGGSGADMSYWTSTGEPAPTWAAATVTPRDIDALALLARRTGWQVVFTVNLAHYDPARAADEVAYVARALRGSLRAVEIGNEPNLLLSRHREVLDRLRGLRAGHQAAHAARTVHRSRRRGGTRIRPGGVDRKSVV